MRKKISRLCYALLLLFTLGINISGKDKEKPDPFAKVDKPMVEAAINKGLKFLLGSIKMKQPLNPFLTPPNVTGLTAEEFVLYTLIKGGANTQDESFNALLEKVLAKKLERTYQVSVLAMALSELDGRKYQAKIAECGQFLIDNQCKNGQWDYGQPVDPSNIKITPSPSGSSSGGTEAVRSVPLQRRKEGRPEGDNSNAQYACLGLRACMQSGVIIPTDVFARTMQWLEKNQQKDGGWGYGAKHGNQISSYGSMTVGMLGTLIVCKFYQIRKIPSNDARVRQGLDWVIKNFTVTENPQFGQAGGAPGAPSPQMWHYYYLYAMERLGAFLETEEFGQHEWYPTGAKMLLERQQPNGSWQNQIDDTCFAILFLRRATKPLRIVITK